MLTKKKSIILLVLILALGFFLRFWNIENTPPGIYPDEAVNGVDAMNALRHGQWQWFYEANNGREGLIMNINAILFNFLGVTILALKLPNIIFGTLTILGIYLLAKEMFNSRRLGLIAALLVSSAFWSLIFSRMAFRANMLPLVLAFSFYFLWKGIRTKKYLPFIWGGLIFGIGLHTYIAFRIAPLILVVVLATFMINRKRFLQEYWKYILVFVFFTSVSAAPMLYTFYQHPEYIQSRTSNVSVFNPEVNKGHLVQALAKSIGLSVVKYNLWGDQNWRHNYPPYAILDPITSMAFTFGFVFVVLRFIHLWSLRIYRGERHERLETYTFLLAWFFVMLIPEFMTAEGNPHALRSIGTLPVVFIFSALTFEYFFRKGEQHTPLFRKIVVFISVFMLLFIAIFNSVKYHYFWANQKKVAESYDANIWEVSNRVKAIPDTKEVAIVVEVMQRIPIQLFNWERPNVHYYYPSEIDQINSTNDNLEIILTDYNEEAINNLKNRFPSLDFKEIKDRFGLSYYVME